ncbi:toll/interleukin-1 receptor domain-containing protein [Sorangium cellulosum]|uniref:toll/interleukin-1 receptor domain-containing protein n=1 Tax=Sorangium cellulosum TaxID=56 RepID=UPI0018F7AAD0|nr:toll/interleukin-1 receptor domain-containing protein [Sorangium cellulosum]
MSPLTVFLAYAPKDEALREELAAHLAVLRHRRLLRDVHEGSVVAGEERAQALREELNAARVILLLVSADFLASPSCAEQTSLALDRQRAGQARVVAVILRACDWQGAPFDGLTTLPRTGKPVTSHKNRDKAWSTVTRDIRALLEELASAPGCSGAQSSDLTAPEDRLRSGGLPPAPDTARGLTPPSLALQEDRLLAPRHTPRHAPTPSSASTPTSGPRRSEASASPSTVRLARQNLSAPATAPRTPAAHSAGGDVLLVDPSPLTRRAGPLIEVSYDSRKTFIDLLNTIYVTAGIRPFVPPFTYQVSWLLRDGKSGRVFRVGSRENLRHSGGKTLGELGIFPGMTLQVVAAKDT